MKKESMVMSNGVYLTDRELMKKELEESQKIVVTNEVLDRAMDVLLEIENVAEAACEVAGDIRYEMAQAELIDHQQELLNNISKATDMLVPKDTLEEANNLLEAQKEKEEVLLIDKTDDEKQSSTIKP